MNWSRNRVAALALAGIGWAVSVFMMLRGLALAGRGPAFDVSLPCPGCDLVLGSANSFQLGLLLAGWGLVYFSAFAMLVGSAHRLADSVARIVVATGCGFSL